jgi:hypothetical protein
MEEKIAVKKTGDCPDPPLRMGLPPLSRATVGHGFGDAVMKDIGKFLYFQIHGESCYETDCPVDR